MGEQLQYNTRPTSSSSKQEHTMHKTKVFFIVVLVIRYRWVPNDYYSSSLVLLLFDENYNNSQKTPRLPKS